MATTSTTRACQFCCALFEDKDQDDSDDDDDDRDDDDDACKRQSKQVFLVPHPHVGPPRLPLLKGEPVPPGLRFAGHVHLRPEQAWMATVYGTILKREKIRKLPWRPFM